jgi:hypothetical protein
MNRTGGRHARREDYPAAGTGFEIVAAKRNHVDKSIGDVEGLNGELAVRVVRRTSEGITVSATVRFTTAQPQLAPPAVILNRYTGRQWWALSALLPGADRINGMPARLLTADLDTAIGFYRGWFDVSWDKTEAGATFKSFWSTVKLLWQDGMIKRVFVTGISSLSLTDLGSGYNIGQNLSFDQDLAGLCGLTCQDIEAALGEVCGSDREAYQYHLSNMTKFFNGYHFCNQKKVETVYNTETCLAYLQVRNNIR